MKNQCDVDDCNNEVWARGWCGKHYQRWRTKGSVDITSREYGFTGPCEVDGCETPARVKKMCGAHYNRWKKYGDPNVYYIRRKEEHPSWTGGRVYVNGYVKIHVGKDYQFNSMVDRHGYILEHRKIIAESLERPLDSKETVHHINGIKDDNRPENLQLRNGHHGAGVVMVCRGCGSNDIETVEL